MEWILFTFDIVAIPHARFFLLHTPTKLIVALVKFCINRANKNTGLFKQFVLIVCL